MDRQQSTAGSRAPVAQDSGRRAETSQALASWEDGCLPIFVERIQDFVGVLTKPWSVAA